MLHSRRSLLTGLGALFVASPAIVRASSLMPVKPLARPPLLLKNTTMVFTCEYEVNLLQTSYCFIRNADGSVCIVAGSVLSALPYSAPSPLG